MARTEQELRRNLKNYNYHGTTMDLTSIMMHIISHNEPYAREILRKKGIDSHTAEKLIEEVEEVAGEIGREYIEQKQKIAEKRKRYEDLAVNIGAAIYEYKVLSFIDSITGTCNTKDIQAELNRLAETGWHVKGVFSNELGKNALAILGIGINGTVDQSIVILERDIRFRDLENKPLSKLASAKPDNLVEPSPEKEKAYALANQLMNDARYEEAFEAFVELDDYKDSEIKMEICADKMKEG